MSRSILGTDGGSVAVPEGALRDQIDKTVRYPARSGADFLFVAIFIAKILSPESRTAFY